MLETKADFPQETEQRKSTHRVPRFIVFNMAMVLMMCSMTDSPAQFMKLSVSISKLRPKIMQIRISKEHKTKGVYREQQFSRSIKHTIHDKVLELMNAASGQQHCSTWDCLKSFHDH